MAPMNTAATARETQNDAPGPQAGPEQPDRAGGGGHDHGPPPVVLLVVAIVLIVGSYLLSVKLRDMGRLEDCLMSGRTNCAPIEVPADR